MGKQIKSIDSLSDKELKEIREIQELIESGIITPTLINSLMMSVVMNLFGTYFSIVDNMDVIDKELHVMLTDTVDMILKENKELDDSDRINIMVKLIKK